MGRQTAQADGGRSCAEEGTNDSSITSRPGGANAGAPNVDALPRERNEAARASAGEGRRDASVASTLPAGQCRAVVQRIQREQFGVGVDLPPVAQRLLRNQQRRVGRALSRLSHGLYSEARWLVPDCGRVTGDAQSTWAGIREGNACGV